MNQITGLTKRDLFEIVFRGFQITDELFGNTDYFGINYHGRLEIPEFLNRLYNLKELPSLDSRYDNAETDIYIHTVVNEDYPIDFILDDERFNLRQASDESLLNFICEVFHPEVRDEKSTWINVKQQISGLLYADGYEIIPISEISGREVYGWRFIGNLFKPFSVRFAQQIKRGEIKFSLSSKTRKQILGAFSKFDENIYATTETGWNYNYWISEKLLENIQQFYEPKNFDNSNNFVTSQTLNDFITRGRPYCVLDAIEIFMLEIYNYKCASYINSILDSSDSTCQYRIKNGIFCLGEVVISSPINITLIEKGVKELMEDAISKHNAGNIQDAVEKLWDALERIKTVLIPGNKKHSADLLIKKMSNGDSNIYKIYNDEILLLTEIGNTFMIRHYETDKNKIKILADWEYLYNRCSAFIGTAIKYI